MLIDEPRALQCDLILGAVSGGRKGRRVEKGVYEIHHFGSSAFLRDFEEYHQVGDIYSYGVCDSLENLKERCPELESGEDRYVVTLTPVLREDEPEGGGWRWHKWGEYIGNQNPQHEYLYHDRHIDRVFVFHIYKKK